MNEQVKLPENVRPWDHLRFLWLRQTRVFRGKPNTMNFKRCVGTVIDFSTAPHPQATAGSSDLPGATLWIATL